MVLQATTGGRTWGCFTIRTQQQPWDHPAGFFGSGEVADALNMQLSIANIQYINYIIYRIDMNISFFINITININMYIYINIYIYIYIIYFYLLGKNI